MKAIAISIGNELLNGRTVNSNASYIGRQLQETGIPLRRVLTVRDEPDEITSALRLALDQTEVVLLTGGLGPTHDDITLKVVADFFESELVFHPEVMARIEERYRERGRVLPEVNRRLAYVPEKAEVIMNPVGTAPGAHFRDQAGRQVFVMPGVPREMEGMMQSYVLPHLKQENRGANFTVHLYRTTGIAESRIFELCRSLFDQYPEFETAFLPKFTGVDIRITYREGEGPSNEKFQSFEQEFYGIIGAYIYTTEDIELEAVIGQLLNQRGWILAVAESCTGGMVQHKITNIPGSSDYFLAGLTTYSNQSKLALLGVKETTLQRFGAVSAETAQEMAEGLRQRMGCDVAISTTGIAGPGGATPDKPVGLMYAGLATAERSFAVKFLLGKERLINKERGAQAALEMLRRELLGIKQDG